MPAYEVSPWADLAVMIGGATAALTGLLFVAVSINVRQILRFPGLPDRAVETLTLFVLPLFLAVLLLTPDQPVAVLGAELLVLAALAGGALIVLDRRQLRGGPPRGGSFVLRVVVHAVVVLCLAAAGVGLQAEAGGGLYWLVPAILAALFGGLTNAWVLLVEILR
jgi:hypothetical protein